MEYGRKDELKLAIYVLLATKILEKITQNIYTSENNTYY